MDLVGRTGEWGGISRNGLRKCPELHLALVGNGWMEGTNSIMMPSIYIEMISLSTRKQIIKNKLNILLSWIIQPTNRHYISLPFILFHSFNFITFLEFFSFVHSLDKGMKLSSVDWSLHLSNPMSELMGNAFPACFNTMILSEENIFLSTLGCVWENKDNIA